MGLPRPPDAFHRVYSPPDPPPQSRRPTVIGVLTAVVVLVVGTIGYVVYDRRDTGAKAADRAPSAARLRPSPAASSSPPASPNAAASPPSSTSPPAAVPRLYTLAPQACVVVSSDTVQRLVPAATIARGGGTTASTCDYSGKSRSRYRELRVETQIFAPAGSPDPVDDAKVAIDNRWADAKSDPVVRTLDIEHVNGLGDEAYQRFASDKGQPTVLGEVVVRVRNSLAAVSYVEDAPDGDDEAARQRCLTEATAVVREILRALQ